jgi:hypothetical protein
LLTELPTSRFCKVKKSIKRVILPWFRNDHYN